MQYWSIKQPAEFNQKRITRKVVLHTTFWVIFFIVDVNNFGIQDFRLY
jgi:hypothetical protein